MAVRRRALCVGIDEYPAPNRLDLCVADATEVSDYLSQPEYGFEVELLINHEATRPNIRRALASAIQEDLDFFVFYFSGHGTVTDLDAYLLTVDHQPLEEGIELSDLARFVDRISAKTRHCLTILDCCHAGSGQLGSLIQTLTPEAIEKGLPARTESRTILAACRPEQVAIEDSRYGHGLFTYALLQALSGEAADPVGNVTVGGISEFINRSLEELGAEQISVTKGDSAGRVILATGFTPISRDRLPGSAKRRVLAEARQFLEDYTSQIQNRPDDWRSHGHRSASKMLAPTLRWFTRVRSEFRELRTDTEFNQLYTAAMNRAKQLAEIDLGTHLEPGQVVRRIGGGGFGTVYEIQCSNGEHWAYKVYHPTEYGDSEKRNLFSRGYRAMEQLDHPRVIKVKGYTEAPVGFFMEYVDGPNFRDIPNIIESPVEILRFLLLTAETIAHAHSRTVIHRDIKPENILALYRQEDGTWLPYLADFDLAWFGQATQVTKQAWGNLSYAAPEQMSNPKSGAAHSPLVDVYAFAQLAFYAATGSDPVPLGTADNSKLLREKLSAWPVGAAAQTFLQWYEICSASNPSARYQNFRQSMDVLASIESQLRHSESTQVNVRSALSEIAFSLSGFGAAGAIDTIGTSFASTSGRTSIVLTPENMRTFNGANSFDLVARLSLDRITIEGSKANESKRGILNSRIDDVIRNLPGVRRKPGNQGTFETFITISDVAADRSGIERSRQALSRVIEAIER